MTVLKTERLILRPFEVGDVDELFAVFSNAEAMTFWSTPPHADRDQTAKLVHETMAADPETSAEFVMEFEGRVVGKAGFWNLPEIGYILHPDYWRRGFGREALQAVIAYGFEERKLARIIADVDPDNAGSIALLTKLGFAETGRKKNTMEIGGTWFDSVYFELLPPE
ncbi:MAG: GNAT family N-acetyltransferase [Sulfitobacter sp.]